MRLLLWMLDAYCSFTGWLHGWNRLPSGLWFKRCMNVPCDAGFTRYNGIRIWTRSAKDGELLHLCGSCIAAVRSAPEPRHVELVKYVADASPTVH